MSGKVILHHENFQLGKTEVTDIQFQYTLHVTYGVCVSYKKEKFHLVISLQYILKFFSVSTCNFALHGCFSDCSCLWYRLFKHSLINYHLNHCQLFLLSTLLQLASYTCSWWTYARTTLGPIGRIRRFKSYLYILYFVWSYSNFALTFLWNCSTLIFKDWYLTCHKFKRTLKNSNGNTVSFPEERFLIYFLCIIFRY